MILTASSFGLSGRRFPPHTGVWIGDLKLAAIGVKVRRWVSMHGVAINCNNSLDAFSTIIPCGIEGYGVTSLTQELGREVTVSEAKPVIESAFRTVFGA
jgi:lipoate-protein ligase B